jgi:hypothetical protein
MRGGSILFELKNVRNGRALYFMNQVAFKLGVPFKKITKTNYFSNFPLFISKKLLLRSF